MKDWYAECKRALYELELGRSGWKGNQGRAKQVGMSRAVFWTENGIDALETFLFFQIKS